MVKLTRAIESTLAAVEPTLVAVLVAAILQLFLANLLTGGICDFRRLGVRERGT
jgi:hypothetical protein